jgi:uncharacterized repeat protein (TIGR04138 family)
MDFEAVERIEQAIREDGRYPPEAYEFLQRGLQRATLEVHGEEAGEAPHHVTGAQLCGALRALAVEQWGPLARVVLARWNIRRTRDFGEMVFLLIELGLLGKQPTDRIEDFDDVFDFDEAFGDYEIELNDDTAR